MVSSSDDIELDPLLPRARSAGSTLARVNRSVEPDGDGCRTVWHQGGELAELWSTEDGRSTIQRQELGFFGFAIEYRRGLGLRTGTIAEVVTDPELPPGETRQYDAAPVPRVLELGARLLREARRDYYVQHLLGHINDALTTRFNRPQTQVYGLPRWRERLRRASDGLRRLHQHRVQVALLVGVGMLIGALATLGILALVP